ncbi:putative ribose-5-phosphate isomerase 2 [Glycine max]|nr:putative ribose-5-phosphate isomerase 2 [Glycine max]
MVQVWVVTLSLGIPLSDLNAYPVVDLFIDDVDEANPFLSIIKGCGRLAMPVEVIQFCWRFTVVRLHKLFEEAGCVAKLRTFRKKEKPYVTNNGNFIVGLYFKRSIGDLKVASYAIVQLTGVGDLNHLFPNIVLLMLG